MSGACWFDSNVFICLYGNEMESSVIYCCKLNGIMFNVNYEIVILKRKAVTGKWPASEDPSISP